ncbi:MAG: helix-turn-helix transcriptional regulator, partial [Patescibacteria group bacterium]|nr:helix-turn-helix transcriptional regulator [Patescibacteria group bacterium]
MKNAKYKRLPCYLRRYRKARGLKQIDVARILGLKSVSMLSRWERNVCLPKPLNMLK